ncbi:hypothetical protein J4460_05605 [Candidatus Woesearchaeota archaeon]|nr:hypothetical protein [Candidatus Woesearchaeota archaeon]HIH38739.1 hypothetical protein [Candidatus Woesearchaeota archaeon]HIH48081.1 hypothetical protein [Candidatus Woesearchaeota archaeon]HIJ04278.1 hypothetical protein [Candidatus Woesearchaeota archaeon]
MKQQRNEQQSSTDILLGIIISHLREHHNLSPETIQQFLAQKDDPRIPLSIFSVRLSCFETIVKYLIENKRMKVKEIASELERQPSTIYTTYQHARKKEPAPFLSSNPLPSFPLLILKDRDKPVLEAIVVHLKEEQHLSFIEISGHLCRSHSTIWITYKRHTKRKNPQAKAVHGKKQRI